MRVYLLSLFILGLFVPGDLYAQASESPTTRTALVIGNAAYKASPLVNPANDAEDMAATLTTLGFRVDVLKNASLRDMKEAIRRFGGALKASGGVGLFYFAGHGVQSKGRNYLIPSSADITSEAEVEFESVDANFVVALMEEAKNKVNVLILDACRDNPYARSWRSSTRGLAQMDAPLGTFIAFATAPGQGAADGAGRNGLYTKHLLASLKTFGGSRVEDVFKRVAAEVASESRGRSPGLRAPSHETSISVVRLMKPSSLPSTCFACPQRLRDRVAMMRRRPSTRERTGSGSRSSTRAAR